MKVALLVDSMLLQDSFASSAAIARYHAIVVRDVVWFIVGGLIDW